MKILIYIFLFLSLGCKSFDEGTSEVQSSGKKPKAIPEGVAVFGLYDDETLVVSLIQSNKGTLTDWDEMITLYLKSRATLRYVNSSLVMDSVQEEHGFKYRTDNLEISKNADEKQQFVSGSYMAFDGKKLNDFFAIERNHENKLIHHETDTHPLRTHIKDVEKTIWIQLLEGDVVHDDLLGSMAITKDSIDSVRAFPNQDGALTVKAKNEILFVIGLRIIKTSYMP
ncbi:hypothetical protein N9D31_03215 [Oligoflexaceae bacterium]|nr:hypothetical protein [Oligoflexaceae bacterium]